MRRLNKFGKGHDSYITYATMRHIINDVDFYGSFLFRILAYAHVLNNKRMR